jgi:hypothetical protein
MSRAGTGIKKDEIPSTSPDKLFAGQKIFDLKRLTLG